ncbi:MAG TPA: hypothetical protein VH299_00360 [Solirubrobacterales bacterium]|jgi:hypothetical protein|nr:hypothetical protein [Solirubrobacterales bacterium]
MQDHLRPALVAGVDIAATRWSRVVTHVVAMSSRLASEVAR